MDEEDVSGLVEAGVITGVTDVGTKEVKEVQETVKYSSPLSYTLKPSYLLSQEFKDNKNAQENIFKHTCNFGARSVWRNG